MTATNLAILLMAFLLTAGCDTPWAASKRSKEGISWEDWKSGIRTKEQLAEQKRAHDAEVAREGQELKEEIEQSRRNRERFLRRGLSSADAKSVWGPPNKVNETNGSFGQHEQWVYRGLATDPIDGVVYHFNEGGWLPGETLYLYFENGKLTSWQTSR